MPSMQAIAAAFERLQARGILSPEPWRSGSQADRDRAMALSVATYADDLEGITDRQLHDAAKAYALSGERYWPTSGQLLALVPRGEAGREVELLMSGDVAWGRILDGFGSRWGYYTWPWSAPTPPPKGRHRLSDDPVVDAAMWVGVAAVGGWSAVCQVSTTDAAARAAFRGAYQAAIQSTRPAPERQRLALGATNRPALTDGGGS